MNSKINKGDYGYLNRKKIRQILYTLIFMLLVAVFFFTGYIRYNSTKTVFTVFAVLAVLPAAKQAVVYIVLFPYKSVDKEKFFAIEKLARENKIVLVADLVLTTEQMISNLDMVCIKGGHIVAYVSNAKTDISYTTKYVKEFVSLKYKVNAIKIYTEFDKYQKAVKEMTSLEESKYDEEMGNLIISYSV